MVQETKMKKVGNLKIEAEKNFTIFELVRKNSQGGGLATGISNHLEPAFIREGDDNIEMLVTQCKINDIQVRLINCYAPQECDPKDERKLLFWARLQSEVQDAAENNCAVCIQMDSNAHLGRKYFSNDPHDMNNNGKLFSNFLEENPSLSLLNQEDRCEGSITRRRKKGDKTEESILDVAVVCSTLKQYFEKMKIDEDQDYSLSNLSKKGKCVNSDHFTLWIDFNIRYKKKPVERVEIFNFKSVEGQEIFRGILNSENNLTKCFENAEPFPQQCERWFKEFNKLKHNFE